MTPVSGYVVSIHHFGRSSLQRRGRNSFALVWQQRKQMFHPEHILRLTQEQYTHIKQLLGPEKERRDKDLGEAKGLEVWHTQTAKYYMRVRRYLQTERLIV